VFAPKEAKKWLEEKLPQDEERLRLVNPRPVAVHLHEEERPHVERLLPVVERLHLSADELHVVERLHLSAEQLHVVERLHLSADELHVVEKLLHVVERLHLSADELHVDASPLQSAERLADAEELQDADLHAVQLHPAEESADARLFLADAEHLLRLAEEASCPS
jgi:hypothetical protein